LQYNYKMYCKAGIFWFGSSSVEEKLPRFKVFRIVKQSSSDLQLPKAFVASNGYAVALCNAVRVELSVLGQKSIRRKITFGYYGIVAVIAGLAIFAFIELRYVETKIIFGNVITEFFDTTLEIRRFEKNYFLYKKESDYLENINYVTRARQLVENNLLHFSRVADTRQVAQLREDLRRYRELMERLAPFVGDGGQRNAVEGMVLESEIRRIGKDIITIAEHISITERRELQKTLSNSQNMLIFSIIFLSIVVIGLGQILSRIVVRPLKQLEKSMQTIAEGNFEAIRIDSEDREIVSLSGAFAKMLRELELRQRHLVHSEKLASLGTLLSGVAHELNNPLSNISSSCQILIEEIEEADLAYKKELLAQVDEQTDRARDIVRSLLEFSREKDFKKEVLRLRKLIEETIRFLKGQIPAKVEILVDIPGELVIFADKQRIQQVFLNLIKNAAEAIAGEGHISIEARHSAPGAIKIGHAGIYNSLKYAGRCSVLENTVDIAISDTGSGIPEEVLTKVFDPFFTTKDVGKGSGLGLFIVHEIIEEHDGCIAVDSKPGKGTTFLIRLPLRGNDGADFPKRQN
jgi:two-component system NtrC family sensor kinase